MTEKERLIAGVLAVAFDNTGNLLLTQRNDPTKPNEHQRWQFPGGAIEFGEHPEQALFREIKEELQVTDVELLHKQPIIRSTTYTKPDNEGAETAYQLLMFAYLVTLPKEVNIDNDPETSAYAWVPYSQLETLNTLPLVRGIAEEAKKIWETVKGEKYV